MCQLVHFLLKPLTGQHFCLGVNQTSNAVNVTALLKVHPHSLPLCVCVFFPTCLYTSVNLAVELISQLGLRHVNLTQEGEWTWHPLQRICRISALTKQSIQTHITSHLPQGVTSHCVLNCCACSDQFCLLDDCWEYGMLQTLKDNLMGYQWCYFVDSYDLMVNVLHGSKYLSSIDFV